MDPSPKCEIFCLIVVNNGRKNKVMVKCPSYTTVFWHRNMSHNSIAVKEQGVHYPSDTPTSTSYHGGFIVFTYPPLVVQLIVRLKKASSPVTTSLKRQESLFLNQDSKTEAFSTQSFFCSGVSRMGIQHAQIFCSFNFSFRIVKTYEKLKPDISPISLTVYCESC